MIKVIKGELLEVEIEYKPTTKISMEEYCPSAKPFSFAVFIQDLVNREAWGIVKEESVKLPEYKRVKIVKDLTFWKIFFKTQVKQFVP